MRIRGGYRRLRACATIEAERLAMTIRGRLPARTAAGVADESVAAAARRLGTFEKRHRLSLGGMTVKELLRESRP